MGAGEMDKASFTRFLIEAFIPAAACCQDGAIAFICMDWRHMGELLAAGDEVFSGLKNLCVWNKTNAGMGSFYRSKHELIFGRCKGKRNFATVFMKAMTKSVVITENGKRRKVSKLDAAVTQLANEAARGDKKAIQLAFGLLQMLEPAAQPQNPREVVIFSGVLAEHDKRR
jgi:hypothetical protein